MRVWINSQQFNTLATRGSISLRNVGYWRNLLCRGGKIQQTAFFFLSSFLLSVLFRHRAVPHLPHGNLVNRSKIPRGAEDGGTCQCIFSRLCSRTPHLLLICPLTHLIYVATCAWLTIDRITFDLYDESVTRGFTRGGRSRYWEQQTPRWKRGGARVVAQTFQASARFKWKPDADCNLYLTGWGAGGRGRGPITTAKCSARDCPQMCWQSVDTWRMHTKLLQPREDQFCGCDSDWLEQQAGKSLLGRNCFAVCKKKKNTRNFVFVCENWATTESEFSSRHNLIWCSRWHESDEFDHRDTVVILKQFFFIYFKIIYIFRYLSCIRSSLKKLSFAHEWWHVFPLWTATRTISKAAGGCTWTARGTFASSAADHRLWSECGNH